MSDKKKTSSKSAIKIDDLNTIFGKSASQQEQEAKAIVDQFLVSIGLKKTKMYYIP